MEQCPICLRCLDNDIQTTECNHQFHKLCLNTWLINHSTCPNCRSDLQRESRLMTINIVGQRWSGKTSWILEYIRYNINNYDRIICYAPSSDDYMVYKTYIPDTINRWDTILSRIEPDDEVQDSILVVIDEWSPNYGLRDLMDLLKNKNAHILIASLYKVPYPIDHVLRCVKRHAYAWDPISP